MKAIKNLLDTVSDRLKGLARKNAVVAKTVSVGKRHVIPLCELSMGFGAGGGIGEGIEDSDKGASGSGMGGGAGGAAKARPVAVIVIDDGKVRVESLFK